MAPDLSRDIFITSMQCKGFYTQKEAFDLIRILDQFPTGDIDIRWKNATTGKPVVLGISSGGNLKNK